jgi:hypothetical protein
MEYSVNNFPELPIFLFCDMIHDFLEGPGISGDFQLDMQFMTILFKNYLYPGLPNDIVNKIMKGKVAKNANTFLKYAHDYLYEICKSRGRFFLDLIYNCTSTVNSEVRVLGESFESIKSPDTSIERLSGIGDRAKIVYKLLRLGGKSDSCPDTSKIVYIIEDAFKSDKYFGYIYDTNRQGCEMSADDYYTAALSSVSGVYDQATSSLYTTNIFQPDKQNFLMYKDPGSRYYFQKLIEPVSFTLNYGIPLVVEIKSIPEEINAQYTSALKLMVNILAPSTIKNDIRQKIIEGKSVKINEFKKIVDATLTPEQINLCKQALAVLITNNFFNSFRLHFSKNTQNINDGNIPDAEMKIVEKYIFPNYKKIINYGFQKSNNFRTVADNVLGFRDPGIDELSKYKYKSSLDYRTKLDQMTTLLTGVSEDNLFYLIYYNFLITDILFPNFVTISINEIINENPKYPEIELSINGNRILIEEQEDIAGKKMLFKTKPSVTNMKAKIRKLIVSINENIPKEVLADINGATSRNAELDLESDASSDSSKEATIKSNTKDYIKNSIKEILANPQSAAPVLNNILGFILAKTFGDFSQISTVVGLNTESGIKKCGFPIWFLSFDQIGALISLYLGANTLFQSTTGTAFAYHSLTFDPVKYNDNMDTINFNEISNSINAKRVSFGKKRS